MKKHGVSKFPAVVFLTTLAIAILPTLASCGGSNPLGNRSSEKKKNEDSSKPEDVTVESLPMTATPQPGDGPCVFQEIFVREFSEKHLKLASIKVGECFAGSRPGRFGEVVCSDGEDCSSLAAVIRGADGASISEVEFGLKRLPGRTLGLMMEKVTSGLFPTLGLKVPKTFIDELTSRAGDPNLVLLGATYQHQSVHSRDQ